MVERTSVSFEKVLVQRLRTIRNQLEKFSELLKGPCDVERSTLCRVLVQVTSGPVAESESMKLEMQGESPFSGHEKRQARKRESQS